MEDAGGGGLLPRGLLEAVVAIGSGLDLEATPRTADVTRRSWRSPTWPTGRSSSAAGCASARPPPKTQPPKTQPSKTLAAKTQPPKTLAA
jgi:hypothetical protein